MKREHIKAGKRRSRTQCPIALALGALGFGQEGTCFAGTFLVDENSVQLQGPSYVVLSRYFGLPRAAKRFIQQFDAGKPVKPFTFILTEWKR